MAADVAISNPAVTAVPDEYLIPQAAEIVLHGVTAVVDGTAAAGAFLPTLEIVAPSGQVVHRCITTATVAAGASAEVSWFPLRNRSSTSTASSSYQSLIGSLPFLVGYWPLDEPSGTTMFDLSTFGHNGGYGTPPLGGGSAPTLNQTPLITTGRSALFVGANKSFAEVASTTDWIGTGSFSIVCWIKTTQATAGEDKFIVSIFDGNIDYFIVFLSNTSGTKIGFDVWAPGAQRVEGTVVVNDGVTHNVTCTFDNATSLAKIYVDGALDTTAGPFGAGSTVPTNLFIGVRNTLGVAGQAFDGNVDEVALFNGALTAAQVANIHTAGI